jgi:hypothetical protein
MNLDQIKPTGFILALFIRDDGERFLLGSGAYEFNKKQLHFNANSYANDIVEVQGNDGVFLAGQVRRATAQEFDGYIGDATVSRPNIEIYRKNFLTFFRKNYYYKVVYVFNDGTAIQRKKGFIVDAPEVKELYQKFPEYHISINFEDVNYYAYLEDDDGEEVYGKNTVVPLSAGSADGGLIWDAVGVEWDNIGAEWEDSSSSGPTTITIDSIDNVFPIWEIKGPAVNPELSILTTGTTLYYSGTVTATQTLKIDMFNKTALLNGTSVIGNVAGEWIYLKPGNNRVTYTTDNATATSSTIYWQEIVG